MKLVEDPAFPDVLHVEGRVAVLSTTAGTDVAKVRMLGGRVGSSLRGYGRGSWVDLTEDLPWYEANPDYQGQEIIIVQGFEFDRDPFDLVDDPATPKSWMESRMGIQAENASPIVASAAADADADEGADADADADEGEGEAADADEGEGEAADADEGEGEAADADEGADADADEAADADEGEGEGEAAEGDGAADAEAEAAATEGEGGISAGREVADVRAQLAERDGQLADVQAQLADVRAQLAERDGQLAERDAQLSDVRAQLAERDGQLAERDGQLADVRAQLAERDAQEKLETSRASTIKAFQEKHGLSDIGVSRIVQALSGLPGFSAASGPDLEAFLEHQRAARGPSSGRRHQSSRTGRVTRAGQELNEIHGSNP
jgi:hypothetical protein